MMTMLKTRVLVGLCLAMELIITLPTFGAGAVPPDISTLICVQKEIEWSSKNYSISVPEGEFWDVSSVTPTVDTIDRLNISPAEGAMIRFAPGALACAAGHKIQFGGAGWILIDNDVFTADPMYYGANILVTNTVSFSRYLVGNLEQEDGSHVSSTISVKKGCTFSMSSNGGFRINGNWITKTGEGTLALSGSKGPSAFKNTPEYNSGHLIAEEGVIDFVGMTSSYFFCNNLVSNWTSTVEVYDDAVVKFGTRIPDIHNLVMRGGRIESTQSPDATGNSLILCDSMSILPNATASVIDVSGFGLSQMSGKTNVVTVAEDATLKIQGRLQRSDTVASTGVLRKAGLGSLEVERAEADVTILLPDLLTEAAVWIDATALQGYVSGENVNVIENRGTAGGVFQNFVRGNGICENSKNFLAYKNGQLPGPEYAPAAINGLPALRFCLTNALYTTAYRNFGGTEMSVFCVTAYLPTDCVNCGTNLTLETKYGLIDMTYNGSPLENNSECLNRLIMQDRTAYFGKADQVSAGQFADGVRTQPRVLVASRQNASAAISMFGTDAQGSSVGSKVMTSNLSNLVDVIVLGGYLNQSLRNGPYCRCDKTVGGETIDGIDYTYDQRMASGVIGEYIVFDRKLTEAEEEYVSAYLRKKWLKSGAVEPKVESKSALMVSAAANETNKFAARVLTYGVGSSGDVVAGGSVPSLVKTGSGAVSVTGLGTVPAVIHVEVGELDLSAGVHADTALVASDGTRISNCGAEAVGLASLTVGANVTFVRDTASREASAYKMFDVSGLLSLGSNPTVELTRKPKSVADFISYGSLSVADPIAWTVRLPNGKLCEVEDDRADKIFRLVPHGGIVILFR